MCVCFSQITWQISLPGTGTFSTKWLIHLLLLEAPTSAQATTYRMKLTSVDGGGNLFNRKGWLDPLGLGPETYLGKSYLKEGICYYRSYMLWWYGLEKTSNQSLVFTKLYIYFQGSSKVVNIQFFTLFKPYHNCLEILKPKPRTNSPTVAPRSSPSNLRPEGPNSGSWQ